MFGFYFFFLFFFVLFFCSLFFVRQCRTITQFVCVCFFFWIEIYASREDRRQTQPEPVPPTPEIIDKIKDYHSSGQYYNGPIHRLRPHYTQDKKQRLADDFTPCQKDFQVYKNRTGYVEIGRCLRHRICFGFHVGDCEGLNDIFSVLFMYWKEAPKVIIADFECNEGVYMTNREPGWSKEIVHAVDQFHSQPHTTCSPAVQAKTFKNANYFHSLMNDSGIYIYIFFF